MFCFCSFLIWFRVTTTLLNFALFTKRILICLVLSFFPFFFVLNSASTTWFHDSTLVFITALSRMFCAASRPDDWDQTGAVVLGPDRLNRLIVYLFDLEMMLFDISFVVVGGLKFILCNLFYSTILEFSFQSLNSVVFFFLVL